MDSHWSDAEAARFIERFAPKSNEDVALRVYTSRLIGQDPSLVLHGGGNTSVKTQMADDLGEKVDVLCVKGSGWDLANLEPEGLPAVRLQALQALRSLPSLSDEDMVNAQRIRMLNASAPNPSVETLLHAFLPHKFIDHSHADAILALVNQPRAQQRCHEVFGERLAVVPYIMPGFALAKLAADIFERHPQCEGLLLLQHGLFTFGGTARQSYERHVEAVDLAERQIHARRTPQLQIAEAPAPSLDYRRIAPIIRGALVSEGHQPILQLRTSAAIREFVDDPRLEQLSQRGCATPDHVIRTKRLPLILKLTADVPLDEQRRAIHAAITAYREDYRAYVAREQARKNIVVRALDPNPRVLLVPGLGVIACGETRHAASIVADLYEHTIAVIEAAEALGAYQALPEADLFDMEYWSLEQAKLGKRAARSMSGQVVLITGAAAGIGAAAARRFAQEGAHLYLLDRDAAGLEALSADLDSATWEAVDVRDGKRLRSAVLRAAEHFGGLDGLVSNAGAAPQGAIADTELADLRASFDINFFAHHVAASAAVEIMRRQGNGGFVLFNCSKAAFNPGPNFGPYAIPKAALIALMRQLALEEGEIGIRVNAVNPDRIRTGLLNPTEVETRAHARGLSTEDYYRANLLRREVTADDVAEALLCLARARATTGAVLTVDGGNIAAAPR